MRIAGLPKIPSPGSAFLGALVVAGALAACVPPRPNVEPIPVPPARIQLQGFSFVPLNEPGWFIAARSADAVILGKLGPKEDDTWIVMSGTEPVEHYHGRQEFLDRIRAKENRSGNPRFTFQQLDVQPFEGKGTDCAVLHTVLLDHGATKYSSRSDPMVTYEYSLHCVHPDDATLLVMVAFSYRCYAEDADPAFVEKARAVVETLEFSKP